MPSRLPFVRKHYDRTQKDLIRPMRIFCWGMSFLYYFAYFLGLVRAHATRPYALSSVVSVPG